MAIRAEILCISFKLYILKKSPKKLASIISNPESRIGLPMFVNLIS